MIRGWFDKTKPGPRADLMSYVVVGMTPFRIDSIAFRLGLRKSGEEFGSPIYNVSDPDGDSPERFFKSRKEIDQFDFVCDTREELDRLLAHLLPLREKYDQEVQDAADRLNAAAYLICDQTN